MKEAAMNAKTWALQDAKARFSELFTQVCTVGPQKVTRHGKEAIILLAEAEYQRLSGGGQSLVDFLLAAPKAEFDIRRQPDFGRPVEL
jgi:prevent-host-death family protein